MRIVSLLPSATEMICEIGLGDQLCGVTHECDYPPHVMTLPRVTTSSIPHDATSAEVDRLVSERTRGMVAIYSLDMEALTQIRPDVLVTQTLCDVCAVAESEVLTAVKLLPGQPRVINLSPMSLGDMLGELQQLGISLGCSDQARDAVAALRLRVDAVKTRSQSMSQQPTTVLLEWIDPLFSAGHCSPRELFDLQKILQNSNLETRLGQSFHTPIAPKKIHELIYQSSRCDFCTGKSVADNHKRALCCRRWSCAG